MSDYNYLPVSNGSGDAPLMHLTSNRSIGSTVFNVDTVVNVPTNFIATAGTLLSTGFIDTTTKTDFKGHVSGSTLVIDAFEPGSTDAGNTSGQVVVIKPNTGWANRVASFIKNMTNFGTPEAVTTGALTSSSNTVTGNSHVQGTSTLDGVVSGAGYDIKTISNSYKFSVYRANSWTTGNGFGAICVFDTELYDTGNNYDNTTGKFTAPVSGFYHFETAIQYLNPTAGTIIITSLCVNSTTAETKRFYEGIIASTGNHTNGGGMDIQLTAGDYVCITARANGCAGGIAAPVVWFTGHLVSKT